MNAGALTVATLQNTNQDGLPTLPGGWGSGNIAAVTSKITNGYVGPTRGLFVGSGVPYLQSLHIKANGIKFEPEYFVTEDWSRQHKKSVLAQGDVLVVQTGDIGQVALVPPLWTGANCHALIILAPNENVILGSYLSWVLNSSYGKDCLLSRQTGALHPHLNCSAVREIQVPIPPLTAQNAIASFLDRKTAAIDALIEKKQKLVELLAEKRAALINQAVTKGLDPNVPMKESGIPGIGEVPAHWQVMALRRVLGLIEQGWSPQCEGHPVSGNDWGVLKSGCTAGGCFNENANKTLPTSLEPRLQLLVREGDVLVCRASGSPDIIGSAALVPTMEKRLMLSDKIFRLNFVNLVHPAFVVHALASRASRSQIENMISGAEGLANNLPQARLKDLMFARPPYRDQIAIAQWLESELERLDNVRAVIAGQLSRLQEYRQALITAAVTGQLEIPEARQ